MHRTLIRLLTTGALLAIPSAAHAGGWVTSAPLSPPDRVATFPQVTVTPSGERVIAWVQDQMDGFTSENVSTRVAPTGGDFGPTQTIAGSPTDLQMATAGDGTVAIAWVDFSSQTVHVARLAPGQTSFVEATPFVAPGGETPFALDIAWSGSDLYVAADSRVFTGTQPGSVWALKLAAASNALTVVPGPVASGALEHADNVRGQAQVFFGNPVIAAEPDHVVVGWTRESEDADDQHGQAAVHYALRNGPAFTAPFTADTETSTGSFPPNMRPSVAAGGGHAYVLWTRDQGTNIFFQDLGNPVTHAIASGGAFGVDDLRSAADSSGAVTAVWTTVPPNQRNDSVFSAVVAAGAISGQGSPITPIGIDREIGDIAVASDGSSLVLPVNEPSGEASVEVEAALRPAGGAFGAVEPVSGLRDDHPNAIFEHPPSAFIAPGGRALALWSAADQTGSPNLRLQLSEFDATAPTLNAIAVPAAAITGQSIAVSASASDLLSTPTVSWSFGDGSRATGATVTHEFGSAGAMTVTVTARDSVGNQTSQTRVIAVSRPPTTTPPPDTTPPVLSGLTASNRKFRIARSATAVIATAGRTRAKASASGTVLRIGVSERATLIVTFTRHGHRQPAGTIVRFGAGPGATPIRFSGRIGPTALAPGSYVATVVAIDGSGNRSRPAGIALTVVKR